MVADPTADTIAAIATPPGRGGVGIVRVSGALAGDIARTCWLAAGLSDEVPGTTIDRQCGSAQQAVHFAAVSRGRPMLLLDDVLLELDPEKRRRFIEVLPEYDQAFFTFLPDERYDRYRREETLVYEVTDGKLSMRDAM